jgi:hypothetical protein
MNIYSHNNLFLSNKYTRWYYNIIENALKETRIKLTHKYDNYTYYELHHILPKSLFPEYQSLSIYKWNGILLTAKEHFICHALLTKMTIGEQRHKMLNAFVNIISNNPYQTRYTSKLYEIIKNEYSKSMIGNKICVGRKYSDETRLKMSISAKGNTRRKGKSHTEETKFKMRLARLGKKFGPHQLST